jgi:hypothetical protein
MNFDRRLLASLLFASLSVGSAGFVASSALNYLGFYPALSQIQAQVSSASLYVPSNGQPKLFVEVTVSNPTGYNGLAVRDAQVMFSFQVNGYPNITLFQGGPLVGHESVGMGLGPNSQMVFRVNAQVNPENISSLLALTRSYPGMVMAHANLQVNMITFLESVTLTSLRDIRDVPLSSN